MGIPKETPHLRKKHTQQHTPLKKEDGTYTQNTKQIMEQWAEWIKTNFQIKPELETPEIQHITEQQWGQLHAELFTQHKTETEIKEKIQIYPDLQHIRNSSPLEKTIQEHPQIEKWLTEEYTEKEVQKATTQLKNRKSHGADGIPGEVYKVLGNWITKPMTKILNKIHQGDEIPPEWKNGAIVHIYKQKGDIHETKNYRPICLTKIAYKIWPTLHANKTYPKSPPHDKY